MQRLRDSDTAELMRSWFGLSASEVATQIGIPASTMKAHLAGVYRKVTPIEVETAILELGIRLATQVALLTDAPHRADYLRVSGDSITPLRRPELAKPGTGTGFPLAEHPFLTEIVARREPVAGVLGARRLGPHARRMADHLGIRAGAGVPVIRGTTVHGILSIASSGPQPSRELVRRLADVGRMLEIALANRP